MEIEVIKSKFLNGSFDQNTYVIENKTQAIIIDAGAELEDVKLMVGKRKVLAVLMTHLHFDHFWNLDKYLKEFDCPVYIQENFDVKFENFMLNGSFLIKEKIIKNIAKNHIKYYANKLILGDFVVDVIKTAGHSEDCVCLLVSKKLFTGDTIFADGIGRTDLPDSSNEQMVESLNAIRDIDFDVAYPGHYENATKDKILKTISFYL